MGFYIMVTNQLLLVKIGELRMERASESTVKVPSKIIKNLK